VCSRRGGRAGRFSSSFCSCELRQVSPMCCKSTFFSVSDEAIRGIWKPNVGSAGEMQGLGKGRKFRLASSSALINLSIKSMSSERSVSASSSPSSIRSLHPTSSVRRARLPRCSFSFWYAWVRSTIDFFQSRTSRVSVS
jgi:hypothetical protein